MAQTHYGVVNNVEDFLDVGVNDTASILVIQDDITQFASVPIPFVVTLSDPITDEDIELCEVSSVNLGPGTLTVARATPSDFPAIAHPAGTRVSIRPISQHISELQDHVQRAVLNDPETEQNVVIPLGDFRAIVAEAYDSGTKVAVDAESIAYSVSMYAVDHLVTNDEHLILVDTTAGNVTITLPPAADNPGRELHIKKVAGPNVIGVNDVIIAPDGTELIDGDSDARIAFKNTSARLVSDGAGWVIS